MPVEVLVVGGEELVSSTSRISKVAPIDFPPLRDEDSINLGRIREVTLKRSVTMNEIRQRSLLSIA